MSINNTSQAWIWEPSSMQHYYVHRGQGLQRERMFEKPLTPSDVGKLNRLVIPKQHAEKHFPLDAGSGEKGLLLNFEDESGKAWRFRYSYWSSSQSYVLTKGWSRYVKEKKLDAGDVVQFERYRAGCGEDRFYIGCRQRVSEDVGAAATPYFFMNSVNGGDQQAGNAAAGIATGSTKRLRLFGVNLECWTEEPEPPQLLVPQSWSQFMSTNASTSHM